MAIGFNSGLGGLSASFAARPRSVQGPQPGDERSQSKTQGEEAAPPRVGFGEGTVSALGVAATTVDQNLRAARKIVPTLEELSEAARERASESRAQAAETEEARLDRASDASQRNERAARAQTRFFDETEVTAESERAERRDRASEFFGSNARTITELVVPDPVASFDVFG